MDNAKYDEKIVNIKLSQFKEECFISRSQAKCVLFDPIPKQVTILCQ